MNIILLLQQELEQEAAVTRRFLERVPIDKPDYKPHEKSMVLKDLAGHIAELAGWPAMMLTTPELDFTTMDYTPAVYNNTEALLAIFNKGLAASNDAFAEAKDTDLQESWVLRSGDKIHADFTKYTAIRHALAQTIHHRAQLGVYFRLLDIPVPASYGPSADETEF